MKIQKRKDIWLILAVILIVAALMAAITLFRPDLGSRAAVQILCRKTAKSLCIPNTAIT